MKKIALAASLLAFVASPAFAEDISEGDRCSYATVFEGPGSTTVMFSQSQEQFDNGDRVLVIITNEIWSVKKGDEVGEIKIDGPDAWFSNEALALDHGVALLTDWSGFYDVFDGTSGGIGVIRKGKEIDRLSLLPMFSDVVSFSACHAKRVSAKAERERQEGINRKWNKDPFASDPK